MIEVCPSELKKIVAQMSSAKKTLNLNFILKTDTCAGLTVKVKKIFYYSLGL